MDEILEKLPDCFSLTEIMGKVPPEERNPYVIVAFQECERMNLLNTEITRSLKELDLGLKVCWRKMQLTASKSVVHIMQRTGFNSKCHVGLVTVVIKTPFD